MSGGSDLESKNGNHGAIPPLRLVALHDEWRIPRTDDPALAAIIGLVEARGYLGLTMSEMIAASGLARAEFQRRFRDREEAFQAAYSILLEDLEERMEDLDCRYLGSSAESELGRWLFSFAEAIDEDPRAARVLICDGPYATEDLLSRIHAEIASRLRRHCPDETRTMTCGAVVELARTYVLADPQPAIAVLYEHFAELAKALYPVSKRNRFASEHREESGRVIDLRPTLATRRMRRPGAFG